MSTPTASGERGASNGSDVSFRPKLVPLSEGARQLGITLPTAYRLAGQDQFPIEAIKIGSRWYVRTADLDALTRSSP